MILPDRDTLIALFGTDEPVPVPRRLQAGALGVELVDGGLRDIRFEGIEVLRAIAYVVRDRDWGTYAPRLSDLSIEEDASGFTVRYTATVDGPDGGMLRFAATITGSADGTLVFDVTATPEGDFETNRCGFCVLHPIADLAGRPATVEHVDGRVVTTALPDLIEPWQPFKDMRAITHDVRPGLDATCRMEGDTFEMEDQRAWSDASYKTYVRPLERPWPYTLASGVAQHQSVTLSLKESGGGPALRHPANTPVAITLGESCGTMPGFGLVVTPEEAGATLSRLDRLRAIGPQSLLFHFDPGAGHGLAALRAFAALAAAVPAEAVLECVLPCHDDLDAELGGIAGLVREAGLQLDAVTVGPAVDRQSTPPGSRWPDCPPFEAVYAAARRAFPALRLGGGMVSYFTELNRKRPPFAALDYVTHATCPIVHAADDRSVMQSLEALPFIARSVRAMAGAMPYRIGPSTIGMRQNPYGSRTMDNPHRRRIAMARRDPRQDGLFAAAWTIGYAAALAEADVDLVTGGALTGDFGVLAAEGGVRPVFQAARLLAAIAGAPRRRCVSSAPSRVLGLAVTTPDGRPLVYLANITAEAQTVSVDGGPWQAAVLDESALAAARDGTMPAARACAGTLTLPPYAIAALRSA